MLPDPGEAATAASVNTRALQYLQDNAVFLKQRTDVIDNGGLIAGNGGSVILGGGLVVPSGALTVGQGGVFGSDVISHRNVIADANMFGATGVFGGVVANGGRIDGDLHVNPPGYVYGRNATQFTADIDQTLQRNKIYVGQQLFANPSTFWTIDSTGEQNGDWWEAWIGTIGGNVTVVTSSGTAVTLTRPGNVWAKGVKTPGGWQTVFFAGT